MKLILASGSPRRRRLLRKIFRKFEVKPAETSERLLPGEPFVHAAKRLALLKARAVAKRNPDAVVVGADTIACLGKRNFRKTQSAKRAKGVLAFLSGKTHRVITGVAVVYPDGRCVNYAAKAAVRMKRLDGKMLQAYLKSGEWRGRAGCYDISGKGRALVEFVRGETEAVVGLPLKRLRGLLRR